MVSYERLNKRDIVQICVGSFVGALSFSVEGGILDIGDRFHFNNIILVIFTSIIFSYAISYLFGIRRLGKHRIRFIAGFIPERTLIHYFSALIFSAFILWLFGADFGISFFGFLKRTIILALPATVTGSAVDLIDSQHWEGEKDSSNSQ